MMPPTRPDDTVPSDASFDEMPTPGSDLSPTDDRVQQDKIDDNTNKETDDVDDDNDADDMRVASQFVSFFLANNEYALPIRQIREINRVGEMTRVPNAPRHVLGVFNLRGRIVPIVALKRRLYLGDTDLRSRESRIVVVGSEDSKIIGLLVDRVAEVIQLGDDAFSSMPPEAVRSGDNLTLAVGRSGGRMFVVLDLHTLMGTPV